MDTNLKKYSYWASVIVIGIVLGVSLQFVKAWTEPTVQAPGGNVGAPINASNVEQSKAGGLILNCGNGANCAFNGSSAANGLIVQNGNVIIGSAVPAPRYKLFVDGDARISGNLDIGLEKVKNFVANAPDTGVEVYCPPGKTVLVGNCSSVRNGEGWSVPVYGHRESMDSFDIKVNLDKPLCSFLGFCSSTITEKRDTREKWVCVPSDGLQDKDRDITATAICSSFENITPKNNTCSDYFGTYPCY